MEYSEQRNNVRFNAQAFGLRIVWEYSINEGRLIPAAAGGHVAFCGRWALPRRSRSKMSCGAEGFCGEEERLPRFGTASG